MSVVKTVKSAQKQFGNGLTCSFFTSLKFTLHSSREVKTQVHLCRFAPLRLHGISVRGGVSRGTFLWEAFFMHAASVKKHEFLELWTHWHFA